MSLMNFFKSFRLNVFFEFLSIDFAILGKDIFSLFRELFHLGIDIMKFKLKCFDIRSKKYRICRLKHFLFIEES